MLIKLPFTELDVTEEDVTQLYNDKNFLEDAILSILDTEEKNDLPFTREEYKLFLYDYFKKRNRFTEEYINLVFKREE